jgi:hypothetical protein
MSTDRQEDSIDRQRSQVAPYAARRGYAIIREYTDEGIAGDEERKRKAFMQMLADAGRKQFSVILCDDKDRFGRFDTITCGYYVKPLRGASVALETVAQGLRRLKTRCYAEDYLTRAPARTREGSAGPPAQTPDPGGAGLPPSRHRPHGLPGSAPATA